MRVKVLEFYCRFQGLGFWVFPGYRVGDLGFRVCGTVASQNQVPQGMQGYMGL